MKLKLHGNPYGCLRLGKSPLSPLFEGGEPFGLLFGHPKGRAAKAPFEKGGYRGILYDVGRSFIREEK
jgi:hypothetical protein